MGVNVDYYVWRIIIPERNNYTGNEAVGESSRYFAGLPAKALKSKARQPRKWETACTQETVQFLICFWSTFDLSENLPHQLPH